MASLKTWTLHFCVKPWVTSYPLNPWFLEAVWVGQERLFLSMQTIINFPLVPGIFGTDLQLGELVQNHWFWRLRRDLKNLPSASLKQAQLWIQSWLLRALSSGVLKICSGRDFAAPQDDPVQGLIIFEGNFLFLCIHWEPLLFQLPLVACCPPTAPQQRAQLYVSGFSWVPPQGLQVSLSSPGWTSPLPSATPWITCPIFVPLPGLTSVYSFLSGGAQSHLGLVFHV